MKMFPWKALLLAAAAGALLPASAPGQQTYLLKKGAAVGDVSVAESSLDFAMEVKVTAMGAPAGAFKMAEREREKYTEEVLAVEKDRPSAVRRTYEIARKVETGPDGMMKQTVSTLQGKTVTIRRAGARVVITAGGGKLAPEDEQTLQKEWTSEPPAFFPEKAVPVGEEWSIDPAQIVRALQGAERGEMRGKLVEIVQRGGLSCARIALQLSLEGRPEGSPAPISIRAAGEGFFALDLRRTLDLELAGPITMKGEVEQNGMKLEFNGEGTLKQVEKEVWLKVAGKPVARKG